MRPCPEPSVANPRAILTALGGPQLISCRFQLPPRAACCATPALQHRRPRLSSRPAFAGVLVALLRFLLLALAGFFGAALPLLLGLLGALLVGLLGLALTGLFLLALAGILGGALPLLVGFLGLALQLFLLALAGIL